MYIYIHIRLSCIGCVFRVLCVFTTASIPRGHTALTRSLIGGGDTEPPPPHSRAPAWHVSATKGRRGAARPHPASARGTEPGAGPPGTASSPYQCTVSSPCEWWAGTGSLPPQHISPRGLLLRWSRPKSLQEFLTTKRIIDKSLRWFDGMSCSSFWIFLIVLGGSLNCPQLLHGPVCATIFLERVMVLVSF